MATQRILPPLALPPSLAGASLGSPTSNTLAINGRTKVRPYSLSIIVAKRLSGELAANPTPASASAIPNDAILPDMETQNPPPDWIERAKGRGQAPLLLSLLDAIEPIAPVLAQGLLVMEPLALLWGGGGALRALAEQLEEPDGLTALRRQLAEEAAE